MGVEAPGRSVRRDLGGAIQGRSVSLEALQARVAPQTSGKALQYLKSHEHEGVSPKMHREDEATNAVTITITI